ncbi:MAG TPA: lactonase family protein [Tepidisphaeraceae bacterium]
MIRILIGTYNRQQSKGIYRVDLDPARGSLSAPTLVGEAINPSFIARHPSKPFLYAISEIGQFNGIKSGAVTAYSVDPQTLALTQLNQQSSGGVGPCFVSVDPSGHTVLVANYGSGSVAALPIEADGKLAAPAFVNSHKGTGPNTQRQEAPHAHSFRPTPDSRFALAADLGTDEIYIYAIDEGGKVSTHDAFKIDPGAGPRHVAFSSDQRYVFVANELNNTVTSLAWDSAEGKLTMIGSAPTLPPDFTTPNTVAEIVVHPSGRFVYVSNRGHDSIAVFSLDFATGVLTPAGHVSTQGKGPRNFSVSLDGKFMVVANEVGNNLVAYAIDSADGMPKPTGFTLEMGAPVCVLFVP